MSALSGGEGSKSRSNTIVNSESDACGSVETGGSDVMVSSCKDDFSDLEPKWMDVDVLRDSVLNRRSYSCAMVGIRCR